MLFPWKSEERQTSQKIQKRVKNSKKNSESVGCGNIVKQIAKYLSVVSNLLLKSTLLPEK